MGVLRAILLLACLSKLAYAEGETNQNSSGWLRLCQDVAALRSQPPPFLAKLGKLYEARQTLSKKRRLRLRKEVNATSPLWDGEIHASCDTAVGAGPWRLKVDLAAAANASAAYQRPQRILLVFTPGWPQVLPQIRFLSKLQSFYTKEVGEEKMDYHVREPTGKLLARLHESLGEAVSCMWRQTGSCSAKGVREPERDRLCSETLPSMVSGFCDCDGDDAQGMGEQGFDCGQTPGSCASVCPKSARSPGATPIFDLNGLLTVLHRSLGGSLHDSDERAWQKSAATFSKSSSTVVRYKAHGRKHPFLFESGGFRPEDAIEPRMLKLISSLDGSSRDTARKQVLESGMVTEVISGLVFSFPIFTMEFCELLMEEIRHFYGSKLPAKRPNSMNNYGIILNDIGLEPLIFDLQDAVIQPLASVLLPVEGSELESHHSFTIRYKGGEDTHLDVHTDDSDITFNVNIFGNYTGAPLVFCGINGEPDHRQFRTAYQHQLGHAVLHRGRHRHGAEDISSGERMNLVIWSYSPSYRSSKESEKNHKKEAGPPHRRCVSYTHDRDFGRFREWPEGKKSQFHGRGWCPPRGKEYDGFVPDVPDSQLPRRAAGEGQ